MDQMICVWSRLDGKSTDVKESKINCIYSTSVFLSVGAN